MSKINRRSSGEFHNYFAYGSNMSEKRLVDRVGPVSKIGTGMMHGWKLKFSKIGMDGTGKANIHPVEGSTVHGIVFRLSTEQMNELDKYEGVPTHYSRKTVTVHHHHDSDLFSTFSLESINITSVAPTREAVAYIALEEMVSETPLLPTEEYLNFILSGCRENEFPHHIIRTILLEAQKEGL
jgi:cation transport regulator ChaC